MLDKLKPYWLLMRADKPIGTWLLAWPTLWALLIAGVGEPPLRIVVIFMLGVFLMRSAGCVINDYADRKLDGKVTRTRNRPLATGAVQPWQALTLFAALVLLAFLLVLQLNLQTILLSVVAVAVAALYPFCKRFTQLPQLVLGVAFSMGMLMAFTALEQGLPWYAWVLFAANLLWTVAYDTEYAMADRADDLKVGIKSTAILFGKWDRLIIGLLQLATLGLLSWIGVALNLSLWFFGALVLSALLFVYQHREIAGRDPQRCFHAFLHNHYVGMAITVGLAAHFWL
ncbi:4-hydroxybenzoate polyprenyltransferase [Pseudidiomarina planktonica]|uniref:4-hydroxybenzoate octaprenyltransferase n=1 Tax=Pseudidiomarina planktonica TaxID=1323738 RepID=A0A1Y6EB14_9GAMM|nr:4-hydroxybenzoate octaprenyltransferase [Pseudidiomarina planktonica]RUO66195.1 4-hydroxybenzoate octaprenyltransferase [Pseudidiomarina planktonica]SMQ59768.1 4-hydroxybenzoate polyprenyltransferase [Pseudidiomarina planktonica]